MKDMDKRMLNGKFEMTDDQLAMINGAEFGFGDYLDIIYKKAANVIRKQFGKKPLE